MTHDASAGGLEAKVLVVDPPPQTGLAVDLEVNGVSSHRIMAAESYYDAIDLIHEYNGALAAALISVREPKGQMKLPLAVHSPMPRSSSSGEGLRRLQGVLRSRGVAAYHVMNGTASRALEDLYELGLDVDESGFAPESHVSVLAKRFADVVQGVPPTATARYALRLVRDTETRYERRLMCRHPSQVAPIIYDIVKDYEREALGAILLDGRNRAMGHTVAYLGTIRQCPLEARGIFVPALLANAPALIMFHNHPSGDPAPSREDIQVTRQMVEAGQILNVRVLDHIITGEDGAYASMRERGLL